MGYERLPRGATTLNGCVKAVCTPSRVYGTFYKVKFFTRSGTAGGVERALKETCRVEASIFAHRSRPILRLRAKKKLLRAAWVLGRPHAPRTAAGSRMGSRTDAKR